MFVAILLFGALIATVRVRACNDSNSDDGGIRQNPRRASSTFLWSVDAPMRNARSFLFGTIHVPYELVWGEVSLSAKRAFDASDAVVFELELHNAETVERLAQCKQLDASDSLRQQLPRDIFERLKAYMHRLKQRMLRSSIDAHAHNRRAARRRVRRLFPGDWEQRRPEWLLFLLFQLGDQPQPNKFKQYTEQQQSPMLDLFLAQLAHSQGKQLLSIESAAEQCRPLESVPAEEVLFAINYTLAYLEWTEQNGLEMNRTARMNGLDTLVEQYRCGTLGAGLEQNVFGAHRFAQRGFSASPEADQKARHIDNLMVEHILLRRNERMARRADLLLRSRPSTAFFFALGAGHMLGERSLLAHLRQLGYWLAPVGPEDPIVRRRWDDLIDEGIRLITAEDDAEAGAGFLVPRRSITVQVREVMSTESRAFAVRYTIAYFTLIILSLCACLYFLISVILASKLPHRSSTLPLSWPSANLINGQLLITFLISIVLTSTGLPTISVDKLGEKLEEHKKQHHQSQGTCQTVGHRYVIDETGCDLFAVNVNICSGTCWSLSFVDPRLHHSSSGAAGSDTPRVAVFAQCCRMVEAKMLNVSIPCENGPRIVQIPSATNCSCFDCSRRRR